MSDTTTPPADTPQVAAITWVHDSTPTTIKENGHELPGRHRVLVNNRQAAFLYPPNSPRPSVRIDEVTIRATATVVEIRGNTEDGEHLVWSHDAVQRNPAGCVSCGGA